MYIEDHGKIDGHWFLTSINSRIRKSLFNFLDQINKTASHRKLGKDVREKVPGIAGDPNTQD